MQKGTECPGRNISKVYIIMAMQRLGYLWLAASSKGDLYLQWKYLDMKKKVKILYFLM